MSKDFERFVSTLRCPDCEGSLRFTGFPQPAEVTGIYGTLQCGCFVYPVIDGVPIIQKERVDIKTIAEGHSLSEGPEPEKLVRDISTGQGLEALLDLITFPVCPWPLSKVGAGRKLSQREPLRGLGLSLRRQVLRRRLQRTARLTAEDWLNTFHWHSPSKFDAFNYFFFKFGQPRHLACLSLFSVLQKADKPVLDLACGYGHMLHYLTKRCSALDATGIDQNFYQVWVASRWIAPGAWFVCGDVDRGLPFRDATFSAATCTDALQFFFHQERVVRELQRCAAGGTVILTNVGNILVKPNEGRERTAEGYGELLEPWPYRVLSEGLLRERYLSKLGPDLSASSAPETYRSEKFLSFFATQTPELFKVHGSFEQWPHMVGQPSLNPIYNRYPSGEKLELTFEFPSAWYAFENADMRSYHAPEATLEPKALIALDEVDSLVQNERAELSETFVLLGLPAHYARARRPWPLAPNRTLTFLKERLSSDDSVNEGDQKD